MSLPTTGESAGNELTPVAGLIVSRVDWAPIPRVNLLPPEITAGRQFRGVQRALAAAVVATVLVGGGATWWAQTWVDDAQADLDSAQAQTTQLTAEKAKYAEVPRINAQIDQAEAQRETAMATDVLWYEYLGDLAQATPAEVVLTSMNAQVAGGAGQGAPVASSDPLSPAGIGQIAFSASGERWPDLANWIEKMNSVPGLAGATVGQGSKGGTENSTAVTFSGTVTITPDALSHRYDRKKS